MTTQEHNSYVMQGFREELEKNAVWTKFIASGAKALGKGLLRSGAAAGRAGGRTLVRGGRAAARGAGRAYKAVPRLTSKGRAFASREAKRLKISRLKRIGSGKLKPATFREGAAARRLSRLKKSSNVTKFPKPGTKSSRLGHAPARRQTRISQLTEGNVNKKIAPKLKPKPEPKIVPKKKSVSAIVEPAPVKAPKPAPTPKTAPNTPPTPKKTGFGSETWHKPAALVGGGYALGRL